MSNSQSQENKEIRPPVVGIFGHIDHGKSTLIDYIRKTNITAKEAGGITQHISAYEVTRTREDGRPAKITFLDTPGHEAFANVRTRGANVADIAVLVVSGEDGVKPQTLEVFKYIKESKLPYIVAITKMDKPAADVDRIKANLAEHEIYVEGYGGDTPVVALSAKTGQGVDELLEMISLVADFEDLKGETDVSGSGIIIESSLDSKRGITAVGIVKNGTVSKGAFAASGNALAPIRFILDAEGNMVEEAGLSRPVVITGWDKMPPIGEEFKTFLKKEDALDYIEGQKGHSTNNVSEKQEENITYLPLILKADTAGSLEAITSEILKLSLERIKPKIIVSGVGSVNENDTKAVLTTPGSTILAFNTKTDARALSLAERSEIKILNFNVIYELTEKVSELLSEREPKVEMEEVTGSAKVLKLFSASKNKQVLGARVLSGSITKGANIKIFRREAEIGHGKVRELQQAKVEVSLVNEGSEFGGMIESKIEITPGDTFEAVVVVTK